MNSAALAQPGTLIHARGREWVVLPESSAELLLARPLGGLDEEIAGILPAIEAVESAAFSLPSPADVGDFRSGRLLREAARLSTRAAAGPFRSFARIAVEPRPYQLVPLMMALKLDPVRLLIADDVRDWQDGRGDADRSGIAGSGRDSPAGGVVSAASGRTVAAGTGRQVSHRGRIGAQQHDSAAGAGFADRPVGV